MAAHEKQGVGQAALVAIDGAGRVRAMVGGVDYAKGPYNRAVDAHRQAGSAWKPFVYLAALEAGRTPETMVTDEPVTINGWSPRNYEPEFRGPLTLEQALAHSVNTVAARLADEVGRPNVAAAARRAGIVSAVNVDPAMALGTTLVTPLEMTQAYTTFANGGDRVAAYGLERIRTAGGQVLYQRKPVAPAPAVANPPLGELNQMLRTVMVSGTGVNARVPGYDLAGKTGTTSDYKDAWFCGFTGGFASCVWMGRDDARPMVRGLRRRGAVRSLAQLHDDGAQEGSGAGDPARSAAARAAAGHRAGRGPRGAVSGYLEPGPAVGRGRRLSEDRLGHRHVDGLVAVDDLGDRQVPGDAGQHVGVVPAQALAAARKSTISRTALWVAMDRSSSKPMAM